MPANVWLLGLNDRFDDVVWIGVRRPRIFVSMVVSWLQRVLLGSDSNLWLEHTNGAARTLIDVTVHQ